MVVAAPAEEALALDRGLYGCAPTATTAGREEEWALATTAGREEEWTLDREPEIYALPRGHIKKAAAVKQQLVRTDCL